VVAEAKLPPSAPPLLAQVTAPVYPVPAVVVVTGVAPVTGPVTPAIAATEIDERVGVGVGVGLGLGVGVGVGVGEGEGEGAAAAGTGGGGGVAVVIDVETADSGEAPASLIAVKVNV